jgi:hypothetical protein
VTALPTPTPTPPPSTRAEINTAAVDKSVRDFQAMTDRIGQDHFQGYTDLALVARDQALAQWISIFDARRVAGRWQVGATEVMSVTSDYIGKRQWRALSCIDVSGVDIVDKTGESFVSSSRPEVLSVTYTVEKALDDGVFYVVSDKQELGTC